MQVEIMHRTIGTIAKVHLVQGETIKVEPSAMVGMTTELQFQTGMQGGFLKSFGRLFSGENFFQNTYTAQAPDQHVLLGQSLPGDITTLEVPQTGLGIQSSSYIAADNGVTVATTVGGLKKLFSGEGLFQLTATADGPGRQVVVGSFGGIQEIEVNGEFIVDSGHLVAWDKTLNINPVKASSGGWILSFLSGEGIVIQLTGTGRVWIQSRTPGGFGRHIGPKLPPR